jgi:hypothetical protein
MTRVMPHRRAITSLWTVSLSIAAVAAMTILYAQEQSVVYVFASDRTGKPLLDLEPEDISIKEDVGPSSIVSVRRFGWPLKVTVLLDNGPRTREALAHFRTGLKKFFGGLPRDVSVSLIATAPNPRWLIRDTKDPIRIQKGVDLITPDDGLGRFSDALIEYARRLDEEFRDVSAEQLPPYLPVLLSISNTHQDGSHVQRESNRKMITSLRRHWVWTHMIMLTPDRPPTPPGELPVIEADEGQNAEIAKAVQEITRGEYVPISASGTSALPSKVLPDLAEAITLRYMRQMMQYRVVMERPPGARGPMRDFALALSNHPGAQLVVSTDGNMP